MTHITSITLTRLNENYEVQFQSSDLKGNFSGYREMARNPEVEVLISGFKDEAEGYFDDWQEHTFKYRVRKIKK